jgi:NAD(P)-dependent dehydrogenase (short-subunit alcohol dehydrogenase family)
MTGRVALVTGAASGLGLHTAIGLARLGATVLVHARSGEKAEAAATAVRDLAAGGPYFENAGVEPVAADLASLVAVRGLAADVAGRHPRLHVLVNNAGVWPFRRQLTADGLELTIAVNHLAPFLLTNLLLDRLRAAAPARVVTVSSEAHRGGVIDFSTFHGDRFNGGVMYAQSKLANILFTVELARRLKGSGVTANAVHPGIIAGTRLWRGTVPGRLLAAVAAPFMMSPARGALTSIYLAASPEVEMVTGRYYLSNQRPGRPEPAATDPLMAEHLWLVSAELTGILP